MPVNPHCRIGKVRRKDSPHLAELVPEIRGSEFRQSMHEHVDGICDTLTDGVAGYAIVAWDFRGFFNRATRIHSDAFIGPEMLPAVVAEVLRKDTVIDVAKDVFRGDL